MPEERVIGSYLVRFIELKHETHIHLQNIRTGEQLTFETWVSVWAFLEQIFEEEAICFMQLEPKS